MNLYDKISILGPSAQYDTCGPKDFGQTTNIPGVYRADLGGGRTCRLFKVLQTNSCQNNCRYCAFRRDRSTARQTATADDMAKAFYSAFSRRLVEGLFLSSGLVANPDATMTAMLDTVQILRRKFAYRGYVHLKIMPGSSRSVIHESAQLANRLSLNIESPTESSLALLSPEKNLKIGFYHTLTLIRDELVKLRSQGRHSPSLTTQFVVGAADEKDQDLIQSTAFLYKNFGLKRVFFSAFRPVDHTPLADKPPVPLWREHRLYQADFLLRRYHFSPWDIPLTKGFLSDSADPKLLWAQSHPEFFPINLNVADYWNLLKVPGLGPTSAKKLLRFRRLSRLTSLDQLAHHRFQLAKLRQFACV
jgi:predicted DNA-binding helix-hairpin-helix protein